MIVYIVGSGHSGSTLLDMVLGANSKVFSLGEIIHLQKCYRFKSICTCLKPVNDCHIWRLVAEKMLQIYSIDLLQEKEVGDTGGLDLNPMFVREKGAIKLFYYLKKAIACKASKGYGSIRGKKSIDLTKSTDKLFGFYRIVKEISGKDILVDSSKSIDRAIHLAMIRPDVPQKIIHLVRDGRALVYSKKKKKLMEPKIEGKTFSMIKKKKRPAKVLPAHQSSRRWLMTNLITELALKIIPAEQSIRVRYEDLCNCKYDTVKLLCDFIDVRFEHEMLKFRNCTHHNLAGNVMRFRDENILPADNVWKRNLLARDKMAFNVIAGHLNRYYGYK